MKFAVQLYSLREKIAEKGMAAVLEDVAAAGFDGVEFAGFGDLTPEQAKAELDRLGLAAMGAHISLDEMTEHREEVLRTVKTLSLPTVAVPWLDKSLLASDEGKLAVVEKIKSACAAFSELGVQLLYHNHAFEFEGGGDLVREFLAAVPGLKSELDIFWVTVVGLNAKKYYSRYADDVAVLHVKELAKAGPDAPGPIVGRGVTGAKRILRAAKGRGMEWAVLEAEKFDCDAQDYIVESLAAMKRCVR